MAAAVFLIDENRLISRKDTGPLYRAVLQLEQKKLMSNFIAPAGIVRIGIPEKKKMRFFNTHAN